MRLRLRTLIIVVAAVAIPTAIWAQIEARRDRLRRLAAYHLSLVVSPIRVGLSPGHYGVIGSMPGGKVVSHEQTDLDLWHLGLSEKYRKASKRPWLPVPPDPEPPGTAARFEVQKGSSDENETR